MASDDWLTWLLDHAGSERPCHECGQLTPSADLHETVRPAGMVSYDLPQEGDWCGPTFVLHEVVWVCQRCSLPRRING